MVQLRVKYKNSSPAVFREPYVITKNTTSTSISLCFKRYVCHRVGAENAADRKLQTAKS